MVKPLRGGIVVFVVLLVSFGVTRSVATLGVLSWRLVNFWLPIPAGAIAYVSVKVPRGAGLKAMRAALATMMARGASQHVNQPPEPRHPKTPQPPQEARSRLDILSGRKIRGTRGYNHRLAELEARRARGNDPCLGPPSGS